MLNALMKKLKRYVVTQKLMGQALRYRSGTLPPCRWKPPRVELLDRNAGRGTDPSRSLVQALPVTRSFGIV